VGRWSGGYSSYCRLGSPRCCWCHIACGHRGSDEIEKPPLGGFLFNLTFEDYFLAPTAVDLRFHGTSLKTRCTTDVPMPSCLPILRSPNIFLSRCQSRQKSLKRPGDSSVYRTVC
jgi:hypothetical protein